MAAAMVLQECYTRTHWLIIADLQRTIVDAEAITKKQPLPGEEMAHGRLCRSTALLRERANGYQQQYDIAIRDNDAQAMRRFLNNANAVYGGSPEYSFLSEAL
jgi:hypothetical protein